MSEIAHRTSPAGGIVTLVEPSGNTRTVKVEGAGTLATAPTAPTTATATTGGTLAAGTYGYRITEVASNGTESPASTEVTQVTTGTTSTVTLTLPAVRNVGNTFNIYGRTSGSETLLATGVTGTYTDTGAATPGATVYPTVSSALKLKDQLGRVLLDNIRLATAEHGETNVYRNRIP